MKKKSLTIFLASLILLSFVTLVQAAKNNGGGSAAAANSNGSGQDSLGQEIFTKTPSPSVSQVKNQIETKNEGEDSQLRVETQEETGDQTDGEKGESPRSAMAEEKMSEVAKGVEELLDEKSIKGGIGEQVRQIAAEQNQAQEQIKEQLKLVEKRQGLMKSLLGPDFKALKGMEEQIEANQLRIEQLEELKTQLTNQSELTMLEENIQALIEQNTQLKETVAAEAKTRSMLGWLMKYFSK